MKYLEEEEQIPFVFNMSLGFIPVIISILLCEFIAQDTALYIGMGIGIVGISIFHLCKGALPPNFILNISTGILALLAIATFISANSVPEGAMPLTLEASILIALQIFYLHKKQFRKLLLKDIAPCNKQLYKKALRGVMLSARLTLTAGGLHFIITSLVLIFQEPVSETSKLILYKVFPPAVFLLSILFNQISLLLFNFLISYKKEYVPIVNTKGDVIGKKALMEATNYKNEYINPVIRIAVSINGMVFLCERPSTAILDRNKMDIPLECYLRFGESLSDGVSRLLSNAFPNAKEAIEPKFSIVYHFENEITNRLIYLYIAELKDESLLNIPQFKNHKLWKFKQIEENLGKGFFSSCFENEYEHLKEVICIREKYKES